MRKSNPAPKRKPKKMQKAALSLRIGDELIAEIDVQAAKRRHTRSLMGCIALEEWVAAQKANGG